ncbi:glucosaminidase domain-containing protein [Faecalimonas umbilicata]|uniref:glucosaminidase domain-containing protein n=1 Tax=Faecalimonas umbilicata TaxID=1912855 RepID=UPI0022DFC16A|nr:glucosaminidase domain-containing protein [Faecalimonas umbilicata]
MIRETKQRIVRTIETEVHDREDSLPFSRNQRNKAQKEREQIPGTERLKTGETKGLSVVSPKDPAAYLSRREEKEWNRLSPHAKKKFQAGKTGGQYRQKEREVLRENFSKGVGSSRGKEVTKAAWYPEGIRFSATEKRKRQAQKEIGNTREKNRKNRRNSGRKTAGEKQGGVESGQQQPEALRVKSLPLKSGSPGSEKGISQTAQEAVKLSGEGMKAAVSGAESSNPAGLAVKTARKTADAFRQYLNQINEAVQESVAKQQDQNGDANAVEEGLKGSVRTLAMTVMSIATMGLSVFVNALATLAAMLAGSFAVLFGAVVIVCAVAVILFSSIAGTESQPAAGQGLPSFITEDMMQAFFETQKESGVPVSTGIAQLIAESGFGMYGPGGESGQGMSSLAYLYKNLFGIKYFSGDQYASGSVDMTTGEETEGGGVITGIGSFSKYPDYASCIKQRAWMLERDPYASFVNPYRNQNDGKYTKEAAQGYMQGIRLAGWATSSVYIETCIGHMDTYNLYRFDNMTYEEYKKAGSGSYDGVETDLMKRIAALARENQGLYPCTPDMCAAWVTGVYQAAEAPEIPWGNAIDMWNTYQNTGNTSMENIPPGAVVCGSGSGPMGELYGHVGIYIGNGLVANNVGRFSIETVEEWASWQTATCQGHTGWIGWVYPGGVPTK